MRVAARYCCRLRLPLPPCAAIPPVHGCGRTCELCRCQVRTELHARVARRVCAVLRAYAYSLVLICGPQQGPMAHAAARETVAFAADGRVLAYAWATTRNGTATARAKAAHHPSSRSRRMQACKTRYFIGTTTTGSSRVHCKLYWVPACMHSILMGPRRQVQA